MNESNSSDNGDVLTGDDVLKERVGAEHEANEERPKTLRDAFREFISNLKNGPRPIPQRDPKQDRTRALVLLIGGIVGSVLLFVGVFSTPPVKPGQADRERTQPNLGRKESVVQANHASVTPLLNAQMQSDELGQDPLSAADIHKTSQRNIADDQSGPDVASNNPQVQRSSSSLDGGRLSTYHNDSSVSVPYAAGSQAPSPQRSTGINPLNPVAFGSDAFGSSGPPLATGVASAKSSIVFVRSAIATATAQASAHPDSERSTLLPTGSRLIGRLESAVTSALKTPVVVAIEYNYEKDGVILVPAGTKAIGELQQASANGYVGFVFHTLQMPDGRNEPIEAIATDLRNEPLKGKVTGTNNSRKFLTRTLSGVGTIAAYVVGSGGSGLGQPITGGTLLRDRLAGNVASAGEQELTNATFGQNIVVTVPAQTRLYVVFQKAAVEQVRPGSVPTARGTTGSTGMPTVQELRELMDLRREINQMYTDSAVPPTPAKP